MPLETVRMRFPVPAAYTVTFAPNLNVLFRTYRFPEESNASTFGKPIPFWIERVGLTAPGAYTTTLPGNVSKFGTYRLPCASNAGFPGKLAMPVNFSNRFFPLGP